MDTIEIKDNDINVKDIMDQIKDNIQKRKENGVYNEDTEKAINEPLKNTKEENTEQNDIDYINRNWDVKADYSISSHRPIIGKFLKFGRRLVNDEVKRYVDLIIGKQSLFNACIVRMFNQSSIEINSLIKKQEELNDYINNSNKEIDLKLNDIKNLVVQKKNPSTSQIDGLNYFVFEEKFRGDIEIIRDRQKVYLEYFKGCKNVLDIGCGRGEFLSLLKENEIGSKGIDIDEDMVLFCEKNSLNVEKVDALKYLDGLKDKSLDGIFLSQVIEHLQPNNLINLIRLSHKKMKYGTYFVAETINPLCLGACSNFYADLTHIKPIHPETIRFLLESVGFRNSQIRYLSPFPDNAMLKKIEADIGIGSREKKNIEIMNQNIEKLNSLLYSYQDYAIIAKK